MVVNTNVIMTLYLILYLYKNKNVITNLRSAAGSDPASVVTLYVGVHSVHRQRM